jgi:hypothetical protein
MLEKAFFTHVALAEKETYEVAIHCFLKVAQLPNTRWKQMVKY